MGKKEKILHSSIENTYVHSFSTILLPSDLNPRGQHPIDESWKWILFSRIHTHRHSFPYTNAGTYTWTRTQRNEMMKKKKKKHMRKGKKNSGQMRYIGSCAFALSSLTPYFLDEILVDSSFVFRMGKIFRLCVCAYVCERYHDRICPSVGAIEWRIWKIFCNVNTTNMMLVRELASEFVLASNTRFHHCSSSHRHTRNANSHIRTGWNTCEHILGIRWDSSMVAKCFRYATESSKHRVCAFRCTRSVSQSISQSVVRPFIQFRSVWVCVHFCVWRTLQLINWITFTTSHQTVLLHRQQKKIKVQMHNLPIEFLCDKQKLQNHTRNRSAFSTKSIQNELIRFYKICTIDGPFIHFDSVSMMCALASVNVWAHHQSTSIYAEVFV